MGFFIFLAALLTDSLYTTVTDVNFTDRIYNILGKLGCTLACVECVFESKYTYGGSQFVYVTVAVPVS